MNVSTTVTINRRPTECVFLSFRYLSFSLFRFPSGRHLVVEKREKKGGRTTALRTLAFVIIIDFELCSRTEQDWQSQAVHQF